MGALFVFNVLSWEPTHWLPCVSCEKNVFKVAWMVTDSQTHSLGCQVSLQTGPSHGDSKLASHLQGMSSFLTVNTDLPLAQTLPEMGLSCAPALPPSQTDLLALGRQSALVHIYRWLCIWWRSVQATAPTGELFEGHEMSLCNGRCSEQSYL